MFNKIFRGTKKWFSRSSEKSLDEAYQAALKIKQIEEEHFQGKKILLRNTDYGETAFCYFETELNSYLQIIKLKIAQFKTSRLFFNISTNSYNLNAQRDFSQNTSLDTNKSLILEKLRFIDEITNKYQTNQLKNRNLDKTSSTVILEKNPSKKLDKNALISVRKVEENQEADMETVSDKMGILPRSFLRTLTRIKQEINPESSETEEEVVNKFRKSRYKTAVSIKFLLILIIVPLLVHNVSKIVIGQIFIEPYLSQHEQVVFLNNNLQEEALEELKHFEESLRFKGVIGLIPELSKDELKEEIKRKADELAEDYRQKSANAINNVFADIGSLISFCLILFYSKTEVLIVKSFLDEIIYGLSDSAKAFLIILFTDMFVGFHSPHGWEIILEGIANHFGLPESRDFNFLFIATFPVILDTVLKYWIFRYLNRISPSAVATYKNMNES